MALLYYRFRAIYVLPKKTKAKEHETMKKYALNIEDRKVLVSRLMALTGLHSQYTFMPRCAYIVG